MQTWTHPRDRAQLRTRHPQRGLARDSPRLVPPSPPCGRVLSPGGHILDGLFHQHSDSQCHFWCHYRCRSPDSLCPGPAPAPRGQQPHDLGSPERGLWQARWPEGKSIATSFSYISFKRQMKMTERKSLASLCKDLIQWLLLQSDLLWLLRSS